MKAAVWYSAEDLRVEEVEEPVVKVGMVKIAVEWCGICGSDLHEYLAGPITIPEADTPHPITGQLPPVILGHEFSGEIIELGEGVTSVEIGDRVTVEPILSCGTCQSCRRGYYNICEKLGFHGLTSDGGGFSEYTVVSADSVHKLPEELSFEEGAVVEPAAVAVHAVRQSKLQIGNSCAIFGTGPIGLLLIQAAKAAGAVVIIAIELSEDRLKKASELGATHLINPRKEDTVNRILQITNKVGVDRSFEAAGAEAAFSDAIKCLKPNGEAVIVSLWENPVSFNPNLLLMKECKISTSVAYRDIFPEVISLIASGKINVRALITKKIKLEDLIEEGFKALVNDKSHSKIIVTPN